VTLERLLANGKTPQKIVARARIVLLSGRGFGTNAIQREARVSKPTVWRWQQAYVDGGVERLLKDRGKGARAGKKPISAEVRLAIVTRTAKEKPKHATHWSARMLAAEIGVGHTTVQRVWKEHGLKPHLSRPFKLSNDPKFAEKVVDIVGLYLNPPDRAVVLCVDEKSQIQALDRTQPGLPMKKGRAQTMTHDYKRNGTTTLFAALDVKTGKVIGECLPRHRAKEFIRFLKTIDRAVAKHLDVHAICDNYKTHKTKEVQAWLAKHPRFKLHFTPTSSSWINLVEGCLPKSPASKSGAASSRALPNSRLPSRPGSWSVIPTRSPSNGPPKPIQSWRRMHAAGGRWKNTSRRVLNE
jgi:transposase